MKKKTHLLLLLLLLLPFLSYSLTLRFHPSKLQVKLPFNPNWEAKIRVEDQEEIEKCLKMPFHFLDRGNQCYVFESEDQNYVLKLFRYNRPKFSFVQSMKSLVQKKKKAFFLKKLDQTFQAYVLAYELLSEHTKILYVHFNPSAHTLPKIVLRDPMNRTFTLPLDRYRFIIQRKAEHFASVFQGKLQDQKEIENCLSSLLTLFKDRTEKCIRNSDHNIWPNFGFYEGKPIELDCGNYRLRPELKDPQLQIEEMHRFIYQLWIWLVQAGYHPYADYLWSEFENIKRALLQEPPCSTTL